MDRMSKITQSSRFVQEEIYKFVKMYITNNHHAPHSIHQMAVCLEQPERSVYRNITRMVNAGMLEREKGRNNSPILIKE